MAKTITGKYNSCKVFTDDVEQSCVEQLQKAMNEPAMSGSQIRIMPDCHAGKGCVVGFTMTFNGVVVPDLVGVDIGCGVIAFQVPEDIDLNKLDRVIHDYVPSGFDVHNEQECFLDTQDFNTLRFDLNVLSFRLSGEERIVRSMGTLGGGNHFIEVDKSVETGKCYLVIHTGSRNLGVQVCKHWQAVADKEFSDVTKRDMAVEIRHLVDFHKENDTEYMIEGAIKALKNSMKYASSVGLHYLSKPEQVRGYLRDMNIAQAYAGHNRLKIAEIIADRMNLPFLKFENGETIIHNVHNYIDSDGPTIRKGAISAPKNKMCLIPLNMRDGTLLCKGKGNPDWNYSAPHGAGRAMSRSQARKNISLESYKAEMAGIYTTSVAAGTLDEAPEAYKQDIESKIADTVEVIEHWKPIYNFKADGSQGFGKE